jgi:hypothetical protein
LFLTAIALIGVWKVGVMLHQGAGLLVVLCICVLAALTQHKLSTCEVVISGLEIAEMRKGVAKWLDAAGPAKHQGIVVVRPSYARPRVIADLNIPAEALGENCIFASRCNPQHIWQMINALTREHSEYRASPTPQIQDCRFDQKMALDAISRGQIVLQLTDSGEYVGGEQDQFVINLSSLGGQHTTPHKRTLDLGSPGYTGRPGPKLQLNGLSGD